MPTIYKILGQSAPTNTTAVDLYTVPAATNTVVSTLMISNRASSNVAANVALRPAGATLANQHYISYNTVVPPNDSIALTIGISLGATDVLTVQANTNGANNIGFTAMGTEIS